MEITMSFAQISLLLFAVVCSTNAYSKYGRGCNDIGCPPSEICMIAQDSCSYNQQDGKDCGTYPTCRKSNAVSNSPGLNPGADNRYNPNANMHSTNPNGNVNGFNPNSNNPYYNPNSNPAHAYNGQSLDRNQIFGNPNVNLANPNQPWNNLPIFPPSPTSGGGGGGGGGSSGGSRLSPPPQKSIYPQGPAYPPNPNANAQFPNGLPPQFPFAFGFPPPGSQQYNIHQIHPKPTTRQPGLLDQFLYNKRRNGGASLHGSWKTSSSIFIISICNVLAAFLLINHSYH